MIRNILTLSLLFYFAQYSQAQIKRIDSLKQQLLTEKEDTVRCKILASLGASYLDFNPDTSLLFAQEGLSLAKTTGFVKGEAIAINVIGNIFINSGNYPKALELFLNSLKIFERINDADGIIKVLSNIGLVYTYQGDDRKSLYYYYKALEIAEQKQLSSIQHTFFLNIGNAYEKLDQLDSARLFTQRAYNLSLAVHDSIVASFAQANMGNIYSKMNEPLIAMEFYRASLPTMEKEKLNYATSESYLGIAKLFKKGLKLDSALHYGNLAMLAAKKADFPSGVLLASTFLADYYKGLNKHDSAFFYLQETILAKDSLFSQEKNRQLQNLSFDEMLRQQEIAADKAYASIERRNNLEYAFIIIGIICLAILFILLSRSVNINERWVAFLGVLGLLVVFEFINLFIHPYLADVTNHSPGGMLLVMVGIATLLVPLHHRIERWVNYKIIIKNRAHRLSIAKKIVEKLERESE